MARAPEPGRDDAADIPVLVSGAGPVGLALAIELGRLGIGCMVVEKRDGAVSVPKMSQVSARNMEFCRRWGIAEAVRAAGWPENHPGDIVYQRSLTGPELARLEIPSYAARDRQAFTPESPCHCPQIFFDPILADHVKTLGGVRLRYNIGLETFTQDEGAVSATLRHSQTGETETVTARYLVGCDGPGGVVREALGIGLGGLGVFAHSINVFFRSPQLVALHDKGWARFHRSIDETGCWSEMIAIDGQELWRLTVFDDASPDADAEAYLRRLFGGDFPHEIIDVTHWERRDYVAERFQSGRVFIAGDCAHQCSPTGGYGMHTGIEEAVNLAWKLAAVIDGWGGDRLLDTYETERRPIARRNVTLATEAFKAITGVPAIDADEAARAAAGVAGPAVETLRATIPGFAGSEYLKFQYAYEDSPICVADGTPPPPQGGLSFTPSAQPGARAPHAWLKDGASTLDLFGTGFALLRLGAAPPDTEGLRHAAARAGVPVSETSIADPALADLYGAALILVRPDGHVAWRGDAAPKDPAQAMDKIRGAGG
ncbi:MAG: FAD-dependent monooxygenase [Alphaproteobacteria bacterium]|nr:FAD-dependent monooxygenase [Alphaproteobacteria bacterium]